MFQEQRTSQLPLELDQITDDSAPTRLDAEIKSEYFTKFYLISNRYLINKIIRYTNRVFFVF